MKNAKFLFLGVLLFLLFAEKTHIARAQESRDMAVFVPTSGWLVGPATLLQQTDAKLHHLPCVMANQYNNGVLIRFSGGKDRIMAVAVDFRQDLFKSGDPYDTKLVFAPDFNEQIAATAYGRGTLLINLQKYENVYEALRQARDMTLEIAGAPFTFSLVGVRDGLQRLAACQMNKAAVPETQEGGATPEQEQSAAGLKQIIGIQPPPQASYEAAPVYVEKVKEAELGSAAVKSADAAEQAPLPPKKAAIAPFSFSGAKAQRAQVRAEQQKPAAQAGLSIDHALGNAADEIAETNEAKAPTKEEKAPTEKPAAKWPFSEMPRRTGMHQQPVTTKQTSGYEAEHNALRRKSKLWQVARGTDLQQSLGLWTKNENVRLLWRAHENIQVKESMALQGTFEDAVLMLMRQYADDVYPLKASVYLDNNLGQRVLLVE